MLTEGSYEARIAAVVRRHLEKRFGDWISFEAIMVVLRTDQWGDDSVHVYVVYDGNGEPLDLRWLSGIRNWMRRELRDLGADVIVTTSYIDRSELPSLLDLVASPEAADESRELLTPDGRPAESRNLQPLPGHGERPDRERSSDRVHRQAESPKWVRHGSNGWCPGNNSLSIVV